MYTVQTLPETKVCPRCEGLGYKRFTDEEPETFRDTNGKVKIKHPGSGCRLCHGDGRVK